MSVQLGCNFFRFGPNVNVCLIVQIGKEEKISVLQALLFQNTHLLHYLTQKIAYLLVQISTFYLEDAQRIL